MFDDFAAGVLLRLAYMPLILMAAYVISFFSKKGSVEREMDRTLLHMPVVYLALDVLLEEVLFRLLLQDAIFTRLLAMRHADAATVTTLVFALVHPYLANIVGVYAGECVPAGYSRLYSTHGFAASFGAHLVNNLFVLYMVRGGFYVKKWRARQRRRATIQRAVSRGRT